MGQNKIIYVLSVSGVPLSIPALYQETEGLGSPSTTQTKRNSSSTLGLTRVPFMLVTFRFTGERSYIMWQQKLGF